MFITLQNHSTFLLLIQQKFKKKRKTLLKAKLNV